MLDNMAIRRLKNRNFFDDNTLSNRCRVFSNDILLWAIRVVTLLFYQQRHIRIRLNKAKTKVMLIDKSRNNQPETGDIAAYEVVNYFSCLGLVFINNGRYKEGKCCCSKDKINHELT